MMDTPYEKIVDNGEETPEQFLASVYYDPLNPGAYTGFTKLWNSVKIDNPHNLTRKYVEEWLKKEDSYKRHKPQVLVFPRQKILMSYMDQQWDADIMDMTKFAKFNHGHKYVGVFIDIFSRYAWVEAMKTKTPKEMVNVMKAVFEQGRKPDYMRTDKGSEYIGGLTKQYLKDNNIRHFTAVNAIHASYAERFIRTLKSKLYRYFTKNNTYKYVDILQDMVEGYLDSVHTSTGYRPADISKANQQEVYEKLYLPVQIAEEKKQITYKHKVGDYVHMSMARRTFHKGYKDTYTQEIFVISRVITSDPPRYKLKDLLNEDIEGSCYEQELQATEYDEGMTFTIDRVLYYATKNKVRMAKVSWQGYPDKFNSFVKAEDIKKKKLTTGDSLYQHEQ